MSETTPDSPNPPSPGQGQQHANGGAQSVGEESTTVQIADEAQSGAAGAEGAGDTPYQNLWIPLIVVPAGIVMALVGVFALFGAITTDTNSLSDNLAIVVRGGANERDQALFALMQQAAENNVARSEQRELPHAMDPEFASQVSKAVGELDEDESNVRLALAILLGTLDDPRGAELLAGFLDLSDAQDEDGKLRIAAIQNLALFAEAGRRASESGGEAEALDLSGLFERTSPLLDHPDSGLRGMAVSLLGSLRTEEARGRLVEVLGDEDLGVRASAALALARLDPPDAEASYLLMDLVTPELYSAVREADPTQFRRADDVSLYRQWAVAALSRYTGDEVDGTLKGLLEDPDLRVREAAMLALEAR